MGPRVVVIGGGTGLSVLLRGLKNITDELTAVVVTSDDGGGSGILREDLGMLPPGDIRSCIWALAQEEGLMQELLKYRFEEGNLEGQSFGNLLIAALYGMFGNFEKAVSEAGNILNIKGRVVPVSTDDIVLCAELENGECVKGESCIGDFVVKNNSPIKRIYLCPDGPKATEAAEKAIREAQVIVVGPGSLYTSILPNFLIDGINNAIAHSDGRVVYVSNIMTQPGETDDYGVWEHVEEIIKYTAKLDSNSRFADGFKDMARCKSVDVVIANNKEVSPEVLCNYKHDGARQILPTPKDRENLRNMGIRLVANDFLEVKDGYIRHDAGRVATVILSLAMAMD